MQMYLKKNPQSAFHTIFQLKAKQHQINDNAFEWEEEGIEFTYNGKMYDVVKVVYSTDSAIIYCINDNAENNLKELLSEIQQQQNSPISNTRLCFQKILTEFFEIKEENILKVSVLKSKQKKFDYQDALVFKVKDILSPPPEYYLA
jgi:hypothetical protein